jgi:hypothetical protein
MKRRGRPLSALLGPAEIALAGFLIGEDSQHHSLIHSVVSCSAFSLRANAAGQDVPKKGRATAPAFPVVYIKFCTIQMTRVTAIYAGLDTCGNRINRGKARVWRGRQKRCAQDARHGPVDGLHLIDLKQDIIVKKQLT